MVSNVLGRAVAAGIQPGELRNFAAAAVDCFWLARERHAVNAAGGNAGGQPGSDVIDDEIPF